MKKVWNFITTTVLLVLILTIGVIFVPKFFGIEPMIVLSGSMEPTYHVGSLLYVKDANPDEIKEGDPITFYISDDTLVTHRVVEVDTVNKQYTTKGDANETIDGAPVFFDQVLGTPVFNIPKLGYLGDKLSSLSGKIIYITIIVVVIILMFLGDLIWPEQKEEKKKEEEESINEDINQ
ncbi:MAG: signal peptidase I [Agathobacter sp.]|nr:signal peptidase I [Agathobacter sp.]